MQRGCLAGEVAGDGISTESKQKMKPRIITEDDAVAVVGRR